MQIPQEMPLYQIIHNDEDASTLFLGIDVIANFYGAWGNEYADVAFIAKAASRHLGLVAAVQASLDLLPEMRLPASKSEQFKSQLETALGDAVQDVHVICPDKLKRRRKELESKLANISSQPPPLDPSVIENRQWLSDELEYVENLLQYC